MPAALPDLFNFVSGAAHVALAVSGGSDSMALLRLAAQGPCPKFTVLTVDHGLRPKSADEAQQVVAWCEALGVAHVRLTWEGSKPATGIQARARAARYDLMSAWCLANGVSWLLTAHTMDDQAETVLMRLARTTSFDSLSGIPEVGAWKDVKLLRPMLGLRREALRQMLRDLGQRWIDDPSNADERYERVRIRKAMPLLAELGISPEGLSRFAAEARGVSDGLAAAAADWCRHHVQEFAAGYGFVPLAGFSAQPRALRTRILGRVIATYGAGIMPEPAELALLAVWAEGSGPRRTLGGALIGRRKEHLIIGREPGRIGSTPLAIPASGSAAWDHRFRVLAEPGSLVAALGAGRLGRDKKLPAFVQQSLPAITLPDGRLCVPHLGVGRGATATFLAGIAG